MGWFHLVKAGWRWWGQLVCEWAPVAGRPFSCSTDNFTEMCKKTPWHLGVNGSLQLKTAHTGYHWWHHKKKPGKLIHSSIKSVKTVRASSMQVRISYFTFVDTDDVVWLMSPYYERFWSSGFQHYYSLVKYFRDWQLEKCIFNIKMQIKWYNFINLWLFHVWNLTLERVFKTVGILVPKVAGIKIVLFKYY